MGPILETSEELESIGASEEFDANKASDNYWKRVVELQSKGWARGKARRYLDSIARKEVKKVMKQIKSNMSKPKVDVSDITEASLGL